MPTICILFANIFMDCFIVVGTLCKCPVCGVWHEVSFRRDKMKAAPTVVDDPLIEIFLQSLNVIQIRKVYTMPYFRIVYAWLYPLLCMLQTPFVTKFCVLCMLSAQMNSRVLWNRG